MRLTIYLLRDGVPMDDTVIRSAKTVAKLEPRATVALEVAPFLILGDPDLPNWAAELDSIVDVRSHLQQSASAGAVVLVKRGERVFALTYGTGYHAIEASFVEPSFGLRVAAGLIAERRVRSVQTRGVASNSRDQRTMLPVDGSFSDLNVAIDEDWLRQISGKTESGLIASSASGADSLRLTVQSFTLANLGPKLDEVFNLYESEAFKTKFPFLDRIRPIFTKDPRIEKLDQSVVARIRAKDSTLSFAAPDPFDVNETQFDHYELVFGRPLGRYEIDDLDSGSILDLAGSMPSGRSPLTEVDVLALDAEGKMVDRRRTLKSYLLAEESMDGQDYLLTAGLWFEVSKDFTAQINADVAAIRDVSEVLDLPEWDSELLRDSVDDPTIEGSYNKLVASERGYALLDKNLAVFSQYERLEVADLLTPDGELLCVKSASSSPALSHLVAQAVNSSVAWASEPHQKVLQDAWRALPGNGGTTLDRESAEYVLAIATPKPGPLHESLFFFTKVLLANGLKSISGSGVGVSLAKIPMKVKPATPKPRKPRTVSFK